MNLAAVERTKVRRRKPQKARKAEKLTQTSTWRGQVQTLSNVLRKREDEDHVKTILLPPDMYIQRDDRGNIWSFISRYTLQDWMTRSSEM